ncbi:MAG: glucose-6-phosphate isomerase [Spirochaetales bacterium]|nr:MAG: glucose-6-phosphate isomerase [Spirochaetales bacterium]
MEYKNLTSAEAYRKLKTAPPPAELSSFLTAERVQTCSIDAGGGLTYNYAAKQADESLIRLLGNLAGELRLPEKYAALLSGEVMNTGENRMVLHHLTRGQLQGPVLFQGRNLGDFYQKQQERINEFAGKVHTGRVKGSTGKPFTSVVQIGIGGSDLGPRALYLALKNYVRETTGNTFMNAHFISNVDPDDPNEVLSLVDPERTLFILVTKSGTTQETLTNRQFVVEVMKRSGIAGLNPKGHMIAVTSETSPLAKSPDFLESFYIDDFIGGRYSSTSAVGGAVLSLAFGGDVFAEFLAGAREADAKALEKDIRKNASLLDALLGIYERNILGCPVTAILPYSQALSRFPAHLQQLDMESNGKQVNRDGKPLDYKTGPVIFGEPGTNGQHSFYQLLHQGTDTVPLQFIGFKNAQTSFDIETEGSSSQKKLNANLAAQIAAFALGKADANGNKNFPGSRPSSLLYGDRLTPRALGALLAHFENKVMFQGFAWNINSFDQEGVQLGKVLAGALLKGKDVSAVLAAYGELLNS